MSVFSLRCDEKLKNAFMEACSIEDDTGGRIVRHMMRVYIADVEERQRRRRNEFEKTNEQESKQQEFSEGSRKSSEECSEFESARRSAPLAEAYASRMFPFGGG